VGVRDRHPLILGRDAELTAMTAAIETAAAGHGAVILVQGPAGTGKTTMLRAACAEAAAHGLRTLTARGLALEQGFSYGVVRQLLEAARAADGPGEWDALLDGPARPARCVFDGGPGTADTGPGAASTSTSAASTSTSTGAGISDTGSADTGTADAGTADAARADTGAAEAGASQVDGPHAITHGLYWLTANLAARRPLVLAVDDAQRADASSLRWLSHLAARIDGLPVLLLLATPGGPGLPEVIGQLGDYPACVRLEPRPLDPAATTALVRKGLGDRAGAELCRAAHTSTGGNPFLLAALVGALKTHDGADPDEGTVLSLGPRPVADAVARRIGPLGDGAAALVQALAVLGRPAPLRYVAALADMDLPQAALLTDRLRAASVLAAGALVEFEHPIVRTAVYDAIPSGELALAHARAAALLEADGADTELVGLHLLRSEPDAKPHAVTVLRAAAVAASGRGAPAAAAGYLHRALAEPPPAEARPGILLEFGLALASDRDETAVAVLREAVAQADDAAQAGDAAKANDTGRPREQDQPSRATAALLSAGVLGPWGQHETAAEIARAGLSAPAADPLVADQLEAELFANSWASAATARCAWERIRPRLDAVAGNGQAEHGAVDWRVYEALSATIGARRGGEVMGRLTPVLAEAVAGQRDSLRAVIALLVLIWNDRLEQALTISDKVLADAGTRGSMNMVANTRCLRSVILRRLGRLHEAADDGRAGLEFKLKTSPPLAVAWAAASLVAALTKIGRFAEAEDVVTLAGERRPPDGWIHTVMFTQARGALRVAAQRPEEGLTDLRAAAEGWRALGVSSPGGATWRIPAVTACTALGRAEEAARLAAEQLELARAVGTPATLGVSLRIAAPFAADPESTLAEAIALLEAVDGRYEQGLALAELGAHRRRAGRRGEAREPLRRALDYAERTGAERLGGYARAELLAVGARPRRAALTGPDALTSAERQVAELAAAGRSNRQIAQHLFVTQATVETHLRHAFHKLGITSRADLAARLTRGRE
jgi:DNA-binding CsgD family transcriptional regulator